MKSEASTLKNSRIIAVGTAVPDKRYSQIEIAKILKITEPKELRFFQHPHIETRHLCEFNENLEKNNAGLIEKFKKNAVALSEKAVLRALAKANLSTNDIDYICCVTSTGYVVPSLSLLLCEKLKLKPNCQRSDLVGMGCSAGLNGLMATTNWCGKNSGKIGLLVCCEISSASYVIESGEANALVNSLFGDGAAAALVGVEQNNVRGPEILKFASYRIEQTLDNLKFEWNSVKNLNQFYVSKDTPKVMGENIKKAVKEICINENELENIKYWVLHTGGASILDNIVAALGIDNLKLKNTRDVLKNFGNLSSGSFLFSYELIDQNTVSANDLGLMMTMGPGLAIEMATLKW